MREPKSEPKYCLHKATNQAVVRIAGKDYYLGRYGTSESKDLYRQLLKEYKASGGVAPRKPPSEISITELAVAFLRHASRRFVSPKTKKPNGSYNTFRYLLATVRQLYGELLVSEFQIPQLRAVLLTLAEGCEVNGRAARPLSPYTLNQYRKLIVQVFKWGALNLQIDPKIAFELSLLKNFEPSSVELADEGEGVQPVDEATVFATLPGLHRIVADMVLLQLYTGMRPSEVCDLKPGEIERSSDVWVYRPKFHKTKRRKKKRAVMIGPEGQAVLSPYLFRDPDRHCFSAKEVVEDQNRARRKEHNRNRKTRRSKPVTKRIVRDHFDSTSYRQAVHRACKNLKIEKWNPNQVRHTFGTKARKFAGLEGAQVTLGHASRATTEIYAEPDFDLAKKVAKAIG